MGLDMYLMRRHHIANYKHDKEGQKLAKAICKAMGFKDGSFSLDVPVAYWRKANAIHGWFVKHVQNGRDDCGEYYVSKEQLKALRDLCQAILDGKKSKEEMPPIGVFFLYYKEDLRGTVTKLDAVLNSPDTSERTSFYYNSSW